MEAKTRILWITRTAIFVALLIASQAATVSLGNTIVTGSVVNLLLILSVMTCGLSSGITVAILSPILAKFIGIGPLWGILPFIVAGNLSLISLWHVIGNRGDKRIAYIAALASASIAKFAVLYFGIVRLAVPLLLKLPEKQAALVSGMFSVSQLITALAGGILAIILLPILSKALRNLREG